MNKFNLTFWGEILPGHDPQKAKARFAKMFDIQDPQRLEHFFSGETITLRRNIERKVAAEYYAKLHKLGVEAELIKVDASGTPLHAPAPRRNVTETEPADTEDKQAQWEQARRQAELEVAERARLEAEQRKREAQERLELERQRAEQEKRWKEQQQERERLQLVEAARRKEERERQERLREELAAQKAAQQLERERQELAAAAERKKAQERQEQLKRQAEAEKAEQQAQLLRQKQEQEARRRAEREEKERLKAEQLARLKAEAEAEAAKRKAEEEARRKRREAEAEKRKAERAAAKQRAREEAAKRRAAQQELKRQQAEAAARRKAEREAQRKKQAELAAQRKAQREAEKRAKKKEQARLAAQLREQQERERQAAAEEAARREEEKRKAEELAARERAAAEEKQRQLEAQQKAQQAQEKARQAEEKRQAAELAAKERAAAEEQKRQLAAEQKAQRARETAKRKAELAREREQAQAQKQREAARRAAEREAAAAERMAAEAERAEKREIQRRLQEEQRQREAALEQAQLEERKRLEEQALARGANELANQASLKSTRSTVKSSLDLPKREKAGQGGGRRRQPGAPNDYQTRPFRNTPQIRKRAEIAAGKLRHGLVAATLVLALTLLLIGRYIDLTPETPIAGPNLAAASPAGRLLVGAGERLLLHNRAGLGEKTVDISALGLASITGPVHYASEEQLLLWGRVADSNAALQRCDLDKATCEPLPQQQEMGRPAELAVHPLSGQIFIADSNLGALVKLQSDGSPAARTTLALADHPAMQLDSGLLFMNSAEGPAISVFRYEDQAFGQQLDEVLLLPPRAMDEGQVSVHDFLKVGEFWWASMINPDTGSAGLYLFDSQWKYLREIAVDADYATGELLPWGQKVLLHHSASARVLRFNANGSPEADYHSNLLDELIEKQQQRLALGSAAWALAFSLCLVAAAIALSFTAVQYLRKLVYRARPTRGAEPLDQYSEEIDWAAPVQDLSALLGRRAVAYGVIGLAVVLVCIGLGASLAQLTASLLVLAGPAIGLALYSRGSAGHAGTTGETLVLVDHRDVYHIAAGPRIQYRGPFLIIDDVVVFTGNALLPSLLPEQVDKQLLPVAHAGIRVDRKTVVVKLLEARHPLARAALAIALATLAAIIALLVGAF